jgi:hypothetical protein
VSWGCFSFNQSPFVFGTFHFVDWEFPGAEKTDRINHPNWTSRPNEDHRNFALVLKEFKEYWQKKNKSQLLLTAAIAGFRYTGSKQDWQEIAQRLDLALVMNCTFPLNTLQYLVIPTAVLIFVNPNVTSTICIFSRIQTSIATRTTDEYQHNKVRTRPGAGLLPGPGDDKDEQLNTVSGGMQTYLDAGFKKSQLVVGIPLYGIGWEGFQSDVGSRENIPGLGLPLKGASPVAATAYNKLIAKFEKEKNWKSTFDAQRMTQVYWNGNTVYFMDSPKTVAQKAIWAKKNEFGGLMLWNTNQDFLDDERSLIHAIHQEYPVDLEFEKRTTPFCVPKSDYCNVRCDYKPTAGSVGYGFQYGVNPSESKSGSTSGNASGKAKTDAKGNSESGKESSTGIVASFPWMGLSSGLVAVLVSTAILLWV